MEFQIGWSKNSEIFLESKKIRDIIFVEEDNTPFEEEYDEFDEDAYHIIGYLDHKLVCCARLIKKDETWYVGRVGVLKAFRGKNIGAQLMEYIMQYFKNNFVEKYLYLNARMYAFNFYKKMGFEPIGQPFFEIGIEHVKMRKKMK